MYAIIDLVLNSLSQGLLARSQHNIVAATFDDDIWNHNTPHGMIE